MTENEIASPDQGARTLPVTDLSLVVLIGASGSGKSTFAHRHFKPTEIISSDFCRGLVADDENDQSASRDAFDVLHYIAGKRLAAGRRTVVDATNVQQDSRRQLIDLAKQYDVLPIAIVLDVPEEVCAERNASRSDRADMPRRVITRHTRELRRSLRHLEREGFRKVHILRGVEEIDHATVVTEKRYNDLTHLTGPFDIIGDIHGCAAELETLLGKLGYDDGVHPAGRTAVFVGDLVDRGPDSPGVLRRVMSMVGSGNALCVPGNHENKYGRYLKGRKVQHTHGLAETIEQMEGRPTNSAPRYGSSSTDSSATTSSTAAGSWSATPACPRSTTAAPPAGSARTRSTATPPARPTSSACRCATRGPRTTGAGRPSSTATPRSRRPPG
jgi:protein phosphatase